MTTFLAAQRIVRAAGETYQSPPANLLDGNPATTADIYLTGSGQSDWFALDTGAETAIGSVTLANVTSSGLPLVASISDDPAREPNAGDAGICTLAGPNPPAAGASCTFAAPSGSFTGRYVSIRMSEPTGGATGSCTIGEASYTPALAPPRNLTITVAS